MKVIGIIVEYNPLHNGHIYQINKIKEMYKDAVIIIAISGYYTERGELSVIDKWDKAFLALNYGIDIVLEIPFVFSNQSADKFSYAAIKMLNEFKIDVLVFGSESNDLEFLINASKVQINNPVFDDLVKSYLDKGFSYNKALTNSIYDLTGYEDFKSNDILAISYIKEIIKNDLDIEIKPIKRTNTFLSVKEDGNIISALNIRNKFDKGVDISKYVPKDVLCHIRKIDYEKLFFLIKYKIIADKDRLDIYHLVNEGINNRIYESIFKSNSLDDLIMNVKSKRLTKNKICRILINIFTGFTKDEALRFMNLEYIRVLGFSKKGRDYYKLIKDDFSIPVITKYEKYPMTLLELRVAYLYSLIVNDDKIIKNEIKKHVIML